VLEQLRRAARKARAARCFGVDGRPEHTWHLTLQFLGRHVVGDDGELPAGLVRDAIAAANPVALRQFEFTIDRVERLGGGGKTPCVLRTAPGSDEALRQLHEVLHARLRAAGLGRLLEARDFLPHVTLAYAQDPFESLLLAEPIVWRAREFALLESHIGKSRHKRLAAWPLV
jgi:2'-5' RNA ligase